AERASLRRIGGRPLAIATGGAVRIGEIGMIENIESFKAELGFHPFAEFEGLAHGEIDVAETGIAKDVAAHGAEGSKTIGYQDGITDHVAIACRVQRSHRACTN